MQCVNTTVMAGRVRQVFSWLAVTSLTVACGTEPMSSVFDDASPQVGGAVHHTAQKCDLTGEWALRISLPVEWPRSMAIVGGSGDIVQYARVHRTAISDVEMQEVIRPCGVTVPHTQMTNLIGNDRYVKLEMDAAVFDRDDANVIPATTVSRFDHGTHLGSPFESGWAAIQLGINLPDPAASHWPETLDDLRRHAMQVLPHDAHRGAPSVPSHAPVPNRAGVAYESPLLGVPTGRPTDARAERLWLAVRNVERIRGVLDSCDRMYGDAEVRIEDNQPFLNSQVMYGRPVQGVEGAGENCEERQIVFLNKSWPRMRLSTSRTGNFVMKRLNGPASCQDIRNLKFDE